jgi:exodeoxyribonuclease-3
MSSFPGDPVANEGRVAHVSLTDKSSGKIMDIFGIYFPNGGKSEEAWQGKLVFYRQFSLYMDSLRSLGHSVLWGGDVNCAHNRIDLARPDANDGKIGFHPLERAWLDDCVSTDWHDIWRAKNPDTKDVYSWWDVITRSRLTNVGWRIDYWWGDNSILANTRNIEYIQNQMGSDHCPIMITF